MGNSVSCFDPVREHPPYSWPKDHPGREAAIAEKKRQRRQQKIVGLKGSTTDVSREPAKDVQLTKSVAGNSKEHESKDATHVQSQGETSTEERKEASSSKEQKLGPNERAESEEQVEMEDCKILPEGVSHGKLSTEYVDDRTDADSRMDPDCIPEEAVLRDTGLPDGEGGKRPEILPVIAGSTPINPSLILGEKDVLGDDTMRNSSSGDDICIPSRQKDTEGAMPEPDGALPDDGSLEGAEGQETEENCSLGKLGEDWEGTDTEHSSEKVLPQEESTHSATSFDNRLAQFQDGDCELPEPREVTRDVLDPVTGELISLAEYRGRQMARAEGLVKERVGQYEDVVHERAKQLAKKAAIEAVRNEVMEKHRWTFKSEREGMPQKRSAEGDTSENR
eukprot:GFKZ01011957.1.p1 GENE.GFKZ01011957.1~~GFKZ01011957.1.p1  ORF type:complete len:393 (-),score=68.93 GFKZ01011957.1:595-1773(-)